MNWADEIRKLSDSMGLSNAKTATQLGVSKQYFSAVITELKEPSRDFKFRIWSKLDQELDLPSTLAFMKAEEADELLRLDSSLKSESGVSSIRAPAPNDWVDALVDIRNQRGLTDAHFAAELGVSAPFLSTVLARKKPIPWKLKMAIWSRQKYDLSRDTILKLFLPDIGPQLIELDRQRGRRRAARIAAKRQSELNSN